MTDHSPESLKAAPRRFALPAAVVLLAGLALLAAWHLRPAPGAPLALDSATVLPERRPLADFELLDQHGNAFTRGAFEGRWSLVFAGFTHCPDACPTTMAQLARLEAVQDADAPGVQVVFLSVDPERDTPPRLAEYMDYFGSHLRGATGEKSEIDALCDSLGLAYVHVPRGQDHYTVDHSTAVVLIDPDAQVAAYFRQPLELPALARELATLPPPA